MAELVETVFSKLKISLTKDKFSIALCVVVAFLFGTAFLLTPIYPPNSHETLNILRFPCGVILFLLAAFTLLRISKLYLPDRIQKYNDKTIFLICFTGLMLMGILCLLVCYPGTGMYDSIALIKNSGWGFAAQHSWFLILLVKVIRGIVFALGDGYEATWVTISLLQIFFSSATYAYSLVWLRRKNLNFYVWLLIALFYVLYPFYGVTAINFFKDIPYSLLIVLWIPVLYDFCESGGRSLKNKKTVVLICFLLVFSLFRSNGLIVSGILIFAMLIFSLRKACRADKKIGGTAVFFLAVWCIVLAGNSAFLRTHNIHPLVKESVGIPMQQVAGVIYYDGKISEESKAFINKIIPIEFIKEKFNPYTFDKLKWGGAPFNEKFLRDHKSEFLKTWVKLLIPNLGIYTDVYLRNTYGFWAVGGSYRMYTQINVSEVFKDWMAQNISMKSVLPQKVQKTLEPILTQSSVFLGQGTSFWLFMLFWAVLGLKCGKKYLLTGLPIILGWLTIMAATPVSSQPRYVLYIALALPLLFGILFLNPDETVSISGGSKEPRKPKKFYSLVLLAVVAFFVAVTPYYDSNNGSVVKHARFEDSRTARMDIKLNGKNADLVLNGILNGKASASVPAWFQKNGKGYMIESDDGRIKLIFQVETDGNLKVYLRGRDIREKKDKNKRIPMWIDYTSFKFNGKEELN